MGTLAPNLKLEYQSVERSKSTTNRLKRNPKISEKIKENYDYHCQVCGVLLESPSGPIAIGAHVMPLGCLAPYIRPLIFVFSNKVSGTGGFMFRA